MDGMNVNYCPQCGVKNTGGAFCVKCGRNIISFSGDLVEQNRFCPQCGSSVEPNNAFCTRCGEALRFQKAELNRENLPLQQPIYVFQQQVVQPGRSIGANESWPVKDRITAGLLGIFLGGIGIHKFYLNKVGAGVLYLCFCWTGIPAVVGLIEGIIYLCSSNENFSLTQHVRVR